MAEEFGKEIRLEDGLEWGTTNPRPGQVIEVELSGTHINVAEETWAAFMVVSASQATDRSLTLVVRYLGCESAAAGEELEAQALARSVHIHMCPHAGCIAALEEQPCVIHARVIRVWLWDTFKDSGYLSNFSKLAAEMWLKEITAGVLEEAGVPIGDVPAAHPGKKRKPGERGVPKSAQKRKAKPKGEEDPSKGKKKAEAGAEKVSKIGGDKEVKGAGAGRALSKELKQRLRERLKNAREEGTVGEDDAGSFELVQDAEEISDEEEEAESSDPPSEEGKILDSGAMLGAAALQAHVSKKKVDKVEAIKDGTSRNLETQLIQRALHRKKEETKKATGRKKVKKRKGTDGTSALARALRLLVKQSSSSGTKKKRKEKQKGKKQKKRKVKLSNGQIVSLSASSSPSSPSEEPEESADSIDECEAPLKKKSQEKPGSVLELLTSHVRNMLDQGSTTNVNTLDQNLTSGVKVMTYFQLHIKGQHQGYLREMRELHHLAATIDHLRRGDLGTTGDSLAARFIAVHQSILDAGWATARHLELNPMEDGSAASTAMLLATRKHAKRVAKSQGVYYPGSSGKGRGKGGRGEWYQGGDYRTEFKGEKGKTKKGKGKGKGRSPAQEWTPSSGDWAKNKEKPEEKTA